MKIKSIISLLSYYILLVTFLVSWAASAVKSDQSNDAFLRCLTDQSQSISNLTYTRNNVSYIPILQFNIHNLRFTSPSTPKPLAIITPLYENQIPPVIYCSKKHGMQIRIRSGGHDFEGLSYTGSELPFVMIDLINLRSVNVDVTTGTAWVQSGATIGELYTGIANKSRTYGFPAGICPSVGVGGHFSGGGYGMLLRKYGLAADNVIDARLVDAKGRILDRNSMGEELFWAIRGGGGNSFGVVLAWKVKLVPVPETVTMFRIQRTLEQNATQLIHRWQYVANKFPEDLFIDITVSRTTSPNVTLQGLFTALYLGRIDKLLPVMAESFPELGVVKEDCSEMSWIESVLNFNYTKAYAKGKSDYVQEPISIKALEGIWTQFFTEEAKYAQLFLVPYGGKMAEISESAIPFPHRAGNLYGVQHLIYWEEEDASVSEKYITWIRNFYKYMAPYVSKSPRAAYMNYRDLDLGVNNDNGDTSYEQASKWGVKYYKNNFRRLAQVKTMVDPSNFFRNEQSIPILSS